MKVSVVIPVYNEEKNIGACLQYLSLQEEKPDEIIVVDNNSTDKTAQIAREFGASIATEKIQGMIPARNKGFNEAKYEIIARTDADTRVPKDWIKLIKENFAKNKSLVGLSGPASFYDFPITNKLQYSQWQNKAIFAFIKPQIKHDTLYGPNMAIRKSAWEKIKNEVCLDDKLVHEDTDLAIHLGQHGEIKIDSSLVVDTSFRRYKKPFTYFEYPRKLLKTFREHRLKKAHIYSQHTTVSKHDIGLIEVSWKEFKPDSEITPDTAIIYLPGWSLDPSSKPVEKLCKQLTENLNIRTYALNTKPENISENSLFYEAQAIKKTIQEVKPAIKQVILITHSQGTVKTIHLAHMLWKYLNYEIKGIICITPVGLYKLSRTKFQIKFLGEIIRAIFDSFKEIVQENKSATELVGSVISYVKNEVKKHKFTSYKNRVIQQTHELASVHPVIITKLKRIESKIAFILAEKDFVSSTKRIKNALSEASLRKIRIVEKKNTSHGLPYLQTESLVNEMGALVKDFLHSA